MRRRLMSLDMAAGRLAGKRVVTTGGASFDRDG